ncbi:M1 family metallopeptidase [Pedobacter sp. L105]|uniref:M1 family metallopeptidase n=1 Tax=Pedobacter sp. L105 TaxID=1641871 RepID=UPI00131B8707|nr:M1 family metallopeptidase [Pedobacter sp. L105]
MGKYALFVLFILVIFQEMKAQGLYQPRDIKKAYANHTRSEDGRPGKNYWQNSGVYNIIVTIQPPERTIKGSEIIKYYNKSPDTLKKLNLKLLLNIHKAGAPRFAGVDQNYLSGGIQIDEFKVNGRLEALNTDAAFTNKPITLRKPLLPNDSLNIEITWQYQIALKGNREGMIDSTTYFMAYFYPRIAVYDDYNGWDKLEFLDAAEFYNDFNDYTLNIKVPSNFIVWSTGTLQNIDQVLQPEYAKQLRRSFISDSTIHIVKESDLAGHHITQVNNMNTWIWTANEISDMAFGVSDHYLWDAASVPIDEVTGRRVSMQAAYNTNAIDYKKSVQLGQHSISWLSNNLPGIPFPFPKMTSFQGYSDQEYPMMINDHADDTRFSQQFTQDHEIAHSYFPFYMGTNESRYAFMDEGWATVLELLMATDENGPDQAEALFKGFRVKEYSENSSSGIDLPIITPTSELSSAQNGGQWFNSYTKPALSYLALKDMLGAKIFKKALLDYMANWHGKHPIPWDYFNSMRVGAGKNLNWFFKNWFFSNNYIDIGIAKIIKTSAGYKLIVINTGGFAIPFDVKLHFKDGSARIIHMNPAVWQGDQKQVLISINTLKKLKKIELDTGIFIDAGQKDNHSDIP